MMGVCRACLTKDACLNEDAPLLHLDKMPDIIQAFLYLADIKIDVTDNALPKTVCRKCLNKLLDFMEFRKTIIISNEVLLNKSLKTEIIAEIKTFEDNHCNEERFAFIDLREEENKASQSQNEIKDKIKIEESDIDIKEEFDDLPLAEAFETTTVASHSEDEEKSLKIRKCDVKVKKKAMKRKNEKHVKNPIGRNPRKYIEVDPEKITVIELTREEQLKNQREEGMKPSYLSMPFKCEKCFKGFNYERKLKAHDENFHKLNGAYMCEICNRTMSTPGSMAVHMKKHQFLYQCNQCSQRFVERSRAIVHHTSEHEGILPELPCKHCGKMFRNRSSLNGHMRNHHPSTERPRCEVCQKTFATTDGLQDHMLIHTGEKNYSCQLCDKRFRLRHSVVVHMLSHSSAHNFYCIPCDVTFKSRSALRHHNRTASKHRPPAYKPPAPRTPSLRLRDVSKRRVTSARVRYVCHHCGTTFTTRRGLDRHLSRPQCQRVASAMADTTNK